MSRKTKDLRYNGNFAYRQKETKSVSRGGKSITPPSNTNEVLDLFRVSKEKGGFINE